MSYIIRPAVDSDADSIHSLICELAEFEKLLDQVESTPASIRESLFGDRPDAEAIVAESTESQSIVGVALFFQNYSTFVGRFGIYLEDVYVRPEHRGSGIGKALLVRLAQIARDRGCKRFEWAVLDWNENAINFYQRLGANILDDWRIVRLDADGIRALANES